MELLATSPTRNFDPRFFSQMAAYNATSNHNQALPGCAWRRRRMWMECRLRRRHRLAVAAHVEIESKI
jgi:hypothetical protein